MKILCGTDIIEINRIEKSIKQLGNHFLNRVFTQKEIEYCEERKMQKYQHYAARFAAKEAVFKAVSDLLNSKYEIEWKDIEVLKKENDKPYVNLKKEIEGLENIDISLSHCKEYATAMVIVQCK